MAISKAAPVRRYAYTPAEFATTLGVCRATVYNMITRGELRFVKLGRLTRIPAAELDRLLGVSSGGSAA
jgi:excisionase family DNA binding protein